MKTEYKKIGGYYQPVSAEPDYDLMDRLGIQASKHAEIVKNIVIKSVQCGRTEITISAFKLLISNELYQHEYRHMWE